MDEYRDVPKLESIERTGSEAPSRRIILDARWADPRDHLPEDLYGKTETVASARTVGISVQWPRCMGA
jgi:hypothetical protein